MSMKEIFTLNIYVLSVSLSCPIKFISLLIRHYYLYVNISRDVSKLHTLCTWFTYNNVTKYKYFFIFRLNERLRLWNWLYLITFISHDSSILFRQIAVCIGTYDVQIASCNFRKNVKQSADKRLRRSRYFKSPLAGGRTLCLLRAQNQRADRKKRAGRVRGFRTGSFQNENPTLKRETPTMQIEKKTVAQPN